MFTLDQIAATLGRPVQGDGSLTFDRASEPGSAGPNDLALAMSPAYGDALRTGKARAAILWDGADWESFGLSGAITVPRARLAMAAITAALDDGPDMNVGIHPTVIIGDGADIAEGVSIGPYAVIGANVVVGRGARIAAHVTIGRQTRLGEDALVLQGVRIGSHVHIGDRFVAQPGAIIGADGFSFTTEFENGVERSRKTLGDQGDPVRQPWGRIHSLGSVRIGDDVEVGANTTIDKGTIADTVIGRGTKIDNLVHIGHNNRIGEDCLICGQVGLAGGSTVGHQVVLGGQVGVSDNITIGDHVVAGGATKIFTRVRAGEVILGNPAVKMETALAMQRATRRLPRALEALSELRKTVTGKGQGTRDDG
ncbi:UDP-3-O-(3-hydroxymyristoyl)glucosamine N-acyltransferase [Jannaschia donghaensis]|uniref:UDP-3-O-acylglucosamine N-acyltransferase n=1 Tax=Jannaschia donghaensis TaxID=420998 RepID=A0A0M6YJN1_9RHOB|nr:UDP-3-O-(3-hydroxymyristoyl)glucosamine N-acyltransferase [Jannaschia donghaensis]CTQ50568.1 UDP-3-O-acylglucosamine N-acyltransferase [Jannaschia donghaensis]